MVAHRARRDAPDRPHRRRSARREPRVRRGPRSRIRTEPRARRLPIDRRGPALAARPLQGRRHRRDRRRDRSLQPPPSPRRALADAPSAVEHLSAFERSRQRRLPVGRRRRLLEAGGRRVPDRRARPRRLRLRAERPAARLRGRRREGGRASGPRTTAAALAPRERRPAHLGARLVLRLHRGRSEEPERGLRVQHGDVSVRGRRQDVRSHQGRAGRRRLPRAPDRSRASLDG